MTPQYCSHNPKPESPHTTTYASVMTQQCNVFCRMESYFTELEQITVLQNPSTYSPRVDTETNQVPEEF